MGWGSFPIGERPNMAQEPFSSKDPLRQIALAPILLGVLLMLLGVLAIVYWNAVMKILAMVVMMVLGVSVLLAGLGLVLIGFGLWRGAAMLRRNIKIDQWRIWPGDRER